MKEYLIVEKAGTGEIVEKKSRFIGHVIPVATEEEAIQYIEKIKKQYWDARHNCYAFVIGKNNEVQRFSDDGEPQGTAGKPILEVLLNENVHNTLIVVTRYFGGTLLGTGGLVRAYGLASKEGLKNALVKRVCQGKRIEMIADYNSIGKIKYIMGQMNVNVIDEQYGADVTITLEIKDDSVQEFETKITDATNGKTVFSKKEDIDYKEEI